MIREFDLVVIQFSFFWKIGIFTYFPIPLFALSILKFGNFSIDY